MNLIYLKIWAHLVTFKFFSIYFIQKTTNNTIHISIDAAATSIINCKSFFLVVGCIYYCCYIIITIIVVGSCYITTNLIHFKYYCFLTCFMIHWPFWFLSDNATTNGNNYNQQLLQTKQRCCLLPTETMCLMLLMLLMIMMTTMM